MEDGVTETGASVTGLDAGAGMEGAIVEAGNDEEGIAAAVTTGLDGVSATEGAITPIGNVRGIG